LSSPAIISAGAGSFDSWMRRRGKLGGQNKVPRMDGSGSLTRDLVAFVREADKIVSAVLPLPPVASTGGAPETRKAGKLLVGGEAAASQAAAFF
jgi:hypothetical protein